MTFDLQDQGRTLKIFVTSDPKTAKQTREQILDELVKFSQELGMYDDIIPQETKMRPNTKFRDNRPKTISLTNTNTGKTVDVEVAEMTDKVITVYLADERIVLINNGKHYVGNKFGMELVYVQSKANK
jgi:hypothetical protein